MLPTLEQVRTIGVIGAGTMGHGIVHVAALNGTQVHLYDAMRGAAQASLAKIAKNLENGVGLGKVRPADRDAALARISVFDELTPTWARVDCVIEAVPEVLDLKREIFGVVDKIVSPHALLATNTSSLPSVRLPRRCAIRAGSSACTSSTPST